MLKMPYALYGESIFTSFRSIDSHIPALEKHLLRLFESCNDYFFNHQKNFCEFFDYYFSEIDFKQLGREKPNHYFRLTLFAEPRAVMVENQIGFNELKLDMTILDLPKTVLKKLTIINSPFSKNTIKIKSGSYFQNLYLKKMAMRCGMDDALMIFENELTEATTSNIILKIKDEYVTSDFTGVFKGISLELFENYLKKKGKALIYRRIKKQDLRETENIFLINSVKLLSCISQVDDFYFDENTKLAIEYKEFLKSYEKEN